MYKALPKNVDIDPERALLQSAQALDAAGAMAEKLNDVEGMLSVATLWMRFAEGIHNYGEKMQEEQEKAEAKAQEGGIVKSSESKIDVGFCLPQPEQIIVEGENSDD